MRYIVIVALLLLIVSCSVDTPWQDPPITGDSDYKSWGIHQIQNGKGDFSKGIQGQLDKIGGGATFVATFCDLPYPLSAEIITEAFEFDLIPVISFEPSKTWNNTMQNELLGILNGYWDSTLLSWAGELAALDDTIIIRFGYEMNGDWLAYGQQPELFIRTWRYTYDLFESAGALNVLWMFSPNVEWDGGAGLRNIDLYYPGDEYVDLLGLDGYNFGDNHDQYHWWQSYSYVFEESIQKMLKYKKKLYLAEIGCAEDPRQAGWIKDFLTRVSRDDRVEGFLYFNQHTSFKGEPDWCLACDSNTLEIFKEWNKKNSLLEGVY